MEGLLASFGQHSVYDTYVGKPVYVLPCQLNVNECVEFAWKLYFLFKVIWKCDRFRVKSGGVVVFVKKSSTYFESTKYISNTMESDMWSMAYPYIIFIIINNTSLTTVLIQNTKTIRGKRPAQRCHMMHYCIFYHMRLTAYVSSAIYLLHRDECVRGR